MNDSKYLFTMNKNKWIIVLVACFIIFIPAFLVFVILWGVGKIKITE